MDGCLDLMGPIEVEDDTRQAIVEFASQYGDVDLSQEESRRRGSQRHAPDSVLAGVSARLAAGNEAKRERKPANPLSLRGKGLGARVSRALKRGFAGGTPALPAKTERKPANPLSLHGRGLGRGGGARGFAGETPALPAINH